MEYAIVMVPAAPIRRKPNHRREMVNQLLFGEAVQILRVKNELWVKVQSLHDDYQGWMTTTQLLPVSDTAAGLTSDYTTLDFLSTIVINERKMQVPIGSSLPAYKPLTNTTGQGMIGDLPYEFIGAVSQRSVQVPGASLISELSTQWLNAPYLWGGRTPLGVDCSGFVQVIFKLMGIDLPRDAWQQAQEGKAVKKFKDALPGDLLFFDNKEDIVHVGILLNHGQLIHSSGKVRIDHIDKKGIVHSETGKRGLRLRAVRRCIE